MTTVVRPIIDLWAINKNGPVMRTRRAFLKTLSALLPVAVSSRIEAANAGSRIALVVGNSAYQRKPLVNPTNDARAVATLLEKGGFAVDARYDAGHLELVAAIDSFGAAVRRPETTLAVFYYAGHGVQLDWHNYLVPVDAKVETADRLLDDCVDLARLLDQFKQSKDKTFVIILDACRDDPFGGAYHPSQKGLSQIDAPAGGLLAYSTSPGRVAFDGGGNSSLYTENLVRELSRKGSRLEDALKRVRLNVRLATNGMQIPWESTSLEGDVVIVSDEQIRPTDAEVEKQFEADLAAWHRIEYSRKADDWIAYLKDFPNGRFAEIGQARLTLLLAEQERQRADSVAAPDPLHTSANPFSAGRYPLARHFSVGDEARFQKSDLRSGANLGFVTYTVTKVDPAADRIELNGGEKVLDTMGNVVSDPKFGDSDVPRQLVPAELYVGNKWKAGWRLRNQNGLWNVSYELRVAAFEQVQTAMGEFGAFRIDATGWSVGKDSRSIRRQMWAVPGMDFLLKDELLIRSDRGFVATADRTELVSLRQRVVEGKPGISS